MLFNINTDILPRVRYIGYVNYNKPWRHFPRQGNEYILYIIESGEMYLREDGHNYILKEGDLFLLEPNKLHVGYKEASCSYYYVHFKHINLFASTDSNEHIVDEMLNKRQSSLASDQYSYRIFTKPISYFPKQFNITNVILLMDLFNIMGEAIEDYSLKREDFKQYASCKLYEILIKVCREFLTKEIRERKQKLPRVYIIVQNVTKYINTEYQKKITSNDIEQIFELNYDYLNRVFQKVTGYPILSFLNMVRINKAKELLSTTSLKISEIGYLVGIDNPYYFSRLFKKYVGLPPSKYKKY